MTKRESQELLQIMKPNHIKIDIKDNVDKSLQVIRQKLNIDSDYDWNKDIEQQLITLSDSLKTEGQTLQSTARNFMKKNKLFQSFQIILGAIGIYSSSSNFNGSQILNVILHSLSGIVGGVSGVMNWGKRSTRYLDVGLGLESLGNSISAELFKPRIERRLPGELLIAAMNNREKLIKRLEE